MIAFDAGVLVAYKNPKCSEEIRIRVDALIAEAEKAKKRIVLPAPAMSEYLAGMKTPAAMSAAAEAIRSSKSFKVADFGQKALIETAMVIARVKTKADKKNEGRTWAKAKFDWQIAAIAKVEGASKIYTTDGDVVRAAGALGFEGVLIESMDLPDGARQRILALPIQ